MKLKIFMKKYWLIFLIIIVITYLAHAYLECKFDEIESQMIRTAEALLRHCGNR